MRLFILMSSNGVYLTYLLFMCHICVFVLCILHLVTMNFMKSGMWDKTLLIVYSVCVCVCTNALLYWLLQTLLHLQCFSLSYVGVTYKYINVMVLCVCPCACMCRCQYVCLPLLSMVLFCAHLTHSMCWLCVCACVRVGCVFITLSLSH